LQAISKNQLSQCSGSGYDEIKRFIQDTEEQEAQLDDDEDDETLKKKSVIDKYKSYLERTMKQKKVFDRAEDITPELAAKLQGRSAQSVPQIFHTSASEYMEWIKPSKISYKNQPSLSVDMTGIPAIRQFLYSLPAEQNLKDNDNQINAVLPTFIEKIKRTVTEADRDGGFLTIADEFDGIRKDFMARMLSQAKSFFQSASDASINKIMVDVPNFKDQVTELYMEDWNELKAAAFNRILKCRGTVLKGVSKAKGLEQGTNWNKDLANILAPGFHKWSKFYIERVKPMIKSLAQAFNQFHHKALRTMNNSAANLPTVERAKRRWEPLRDRVRAKLLGLEDIILGCQTRTLQWATMEHDRENNLIAHVTDDIYDAVFTTAPALKPPNPKAKKQYKQYVEPKLKFQKKKLAELFLHSDHHFVDRVINYFQAEFDKAMRQILNEHFAGIEKLFEDYSIAIRQQAPIDYTITPEGEAIRAEVEQRIPELQEKIDELRSMLPVRASQEDASYVQDDNFDIKEDEDNLALIYEKMVKRKVELPAERRQSKRVKQEPK
jgi:hypothetical protein